MKSWGKDRVRVVDRICEMPCLLILRSRLRDFEEKGILLILHSVIPPESQAGISHTVMLYVRNSGDISQMNDSLHIPERFLRSSKL